MEGISFIAIALVLNISALVAARYAYDYKEGSSRARSFLYAWGVCSISLLALNSLILYLLPEASLENLGAYPVVKLVVFSVAIASLTGLEAGVPELGKFQDPNDVPERERVSAKERVRMHREAAQKRERID